MIVLYKFLDFDRNHEMQLSVPLYYELLILLFVGRCFYFACHKMNNHQFVLILVKMHNNRFRVLSCIADNKKDYVNT